MTMIALRPARPADSELLWLWRNAPEVRATAFDTEPIPREQHEVWFERKLKDPLAHIFVAEDSSGRPIGQIRFDIIGREAEVDVALDKTARGQGLGTELIREGTRAFFELAPVNAVSAYVKPGNVSSIRAFEKAAYERLENTPASGKAAVQLRRVRASSQDPPKTYIVAGSRPWNKRIYEDNFLSAPGEWHFVAAPDQLISEVQTLQPRYIFFLHWSSRVPAEVLDRYECVCFHMTDVPYGRGGSPLQNLIIRGHTMTKLTALRMVHDFDAGPVYAKEDLCLQGSAEEIYIRAGELSATMIKRIVQEEPDPVPQEGDVVMFKRRAPHESALPNEGTLVQLHDAIRMLDAEGYPRAFLEHGQFRFEFSRSTFYEGRIAAEVTITLVRPDSR